MANCPRCGIRILGDSTECPVCDESEFPAPDSPGDSSQSGSGDKCPKCHGVISPHILRCIHCGHVRRREQRSVKEPSAGAKGLVAIFGYLIPITIIVGLGYGAVSLFGGFFESFSEESRDQARRDRYERCIEDAEGKAKVACSIDACDVGCKITFMDDPLAITRCINNCRDSSREDQQKLCERAQGTIRMTAIQECPR